MADRAFHAQHAEHVLSFNEANKQGEGRVAISKAWLAGELHSIVGNAELTLCSADWTKDAPTKIHKSGSDQDVSPVAYNEEVICPHGALVVPGKTRVFISDQVSVPSDRIENRC